MNMENMMMLMRRWMKRMRLMVRLMMRMSVDDDVYDGESSAKPFRKNGSPCLGELFRSHGQKCTSTSRDSLLPPFRGFMLFV